MKYTVLAALLSVLPGLALAHSILKRSDPAAGTVLDVAPAEISLTFGDGVRLTALRLGGDLLDVPDQSGFATLLVVPLPPMEAGAQSIEWRGLSKDGHTVKGNIDFTVK